MRRPTMDRAGARGCLDIEDWQLDGLIDEGSLGWVLDIASPGAERRELRFLTAAVAAYRRGKEEGRMQNAEAAQSPSSFCILPSALPQVMELLFGPEVPLVRAQRIYRAFGCKPAHFYDLVAEGALPLARGSAQRPGPGGGGVVAWATLKAFVLKRRVA